jgi:outer membrane protein
MFRRDRLPAESDPMFRPRDDRRRWGAVFILLTTACTPALPGPGGAPATAPAPNAPWTPPRPPPAAAPPRPPAEVPADLAERIRHLRLTDVVDLALRNNPTTAQAWANARAAAAAYGVARADYFPTVDADLSVTRIKTVATAGRAAVQQTTYGPSATLSWLLFDFGARGGAAEAARQALLAADWSHNAAIADVVLQAQVAFFNYVGTGALVNAQQASVKDAQANLDAAEARRRVGVATIADVLQARTALSQAQLSLETTLGQRQTARGALAIALGYPADVPYDVDTVAVETPISTLADSVTRIIDRAVGGRPDLVAARAQAAAAQARIRQFRGARLPSLTASGTGALTYLAGRTGGGNNYTVGVGLTIPLFNGLAREYQQAQAEAQFDAAAAQARSLEQQVTYQVFNSYYALQTARRQVQTAVDLLASAQQSTEVALARYKAGVGTVLDLLSAQSALAAARAQNIQSRYMWYTSLAQLAHDAGALDARGRADLRLTTDTAPPAPPAPPPSPPPPR